MSNPRIKEHVLSDELRAMNTLKWVVVRVSGDTVDGCVRVDPSMLYTCPECHAIHDFRPTLIQIADGLIQESKEECGGVHNRNPCPVVYRVYVKEELR